MQENWTPNQIRFIEWLATPKLERKPETVELLAAEMGVNAATLWRWKKLDGFQETVNHLARTTVHSRLPEVYGALLREAEKGSFQHIKLTLELSGDYVERSETKISGNLEFSADEAAKAAKELAEQHAGTA
jgi:hypothetical protein